MKLNRSLLFFFTCMLCTVSSGIALGQWQDSRLTKNLYIIFDGSGSMRSSQCSGSQNKIDVAKQAFSLFLTTIPDDMNCGLYVFDSTGMREVEPLQKLNRDRLLAVVNEIEAGGSTPLTESIIAGRKALLTQKEKQLGYGEFTMLIITDGEANNVKSLPTAVNPSTDAGIVIQVIGFCLESSHSLKKLVHLYREANSPQELQKALADVLAEADSFPDPAEFDGSLIDQRESQPTKPSIPESNNVGPSSSGSVFPVFFIVIVAFVIVAVVLHRGKRGRGKH